MSLHPTMIANWSTHRRSDEIVLGRAVAVFPTSRGVALPEHALSTHCGLPGCKSQEFHAKKEAAENKGLFWRIIPVRNCTSDRRLIAQPYLLAASACFSASVTWTDWRSNSGTVVPNAMLRVSLGEASTPLLCNCERTASRISLPTLSST